MARCLTRLYQLSQPHSACQSASVGNAKAKSEIVGCRKSTLLLEFKHHDKSQKAAYPADEVAHDNAR
ncbi:MAG TPA: hypothetical protein V6D19_17340 [Stenomitos sp.]